MTIKKPQRLPDPNKTWFRPDGRPTDAYYQYMWEIDQTLRLLVDHANATDIVLADFELRITTLETP